MAEIERGYRWPDPDWWDYADDRRPARGQRGLSRSGEAGRSPSWSTSSCAARSRPSSTWSRIPEIVHYALGKLFDLEYENTRRILERVPGRVNIVYVAEDLGGQTDLMISVRHIREFLLPGMKRMIDLAHQAGAYVFHHDDGNCRRILPDLIDLGIDLLNPIQWRCPGMEREPLKRDFGDRIVLHGGMDNQFTLPFGSVEDVRREVADNMATLGRGGGYILAPCHNIQPLTPVANVIAMYEACLELGRFKPSRWVLERFPTSAIVGSPDRPSWRQP